MAFLMENPIKMDDLGGTTIFGNTHMCFLTHVGEHNFCFSYAFWWILNLQVLRNYRMMWSIPNTPPPPKKNKMVHRKNHLEL